MSLVTDLIAAVGDTQRRIDDQIMKLRSYQSELDSVSQRVDAAFSGSTLNYGQNMIDKLSQTKQQIADTIDRLQEAKDTLGRMQMI